ncbi:hypothetical protein DL766_008461 [Monosporascus sp. MC13-8B]|uniref:Vacuolar protein-sorting-associated protein 25 n=1 Tax=Monosporascus cannonballus TaxID=155416 RepID=A0ABY0GUD7_9PEZI|nr:hypothetical protein DL762_009388 [Monosporascus cannonballus]RYO98204.1 hypothetical protein DL763_002371 [Monosporascus cannonballus]RYP19380.1 hypothetical protein DL766_008461 [Monosporascus sp. MC13-8B]
MQNPASTSASSLTAATPTTSVSPPSFPPPSSSTAPHSTTANTAAGGTAAAAPFEFPREYHFPPFFTRQPNATTRHSQLEKWSALVLSYARHRRLYRISLPSAAAAAAGGPSSYSSSSTVADAEELFHNRRLGRRLGAADAREVLEHMRREGRAEPVAHGGDGGDGDGGLWWVYWKTPDEWAAEVEAWVEDTAQRGVVFTLYELTEGEDTRGASFHGLDPELLQKALQVLVKRGKAQIFGQEDQRGIKFF